MAPISLKDYFNKGLNDEIQNLHHQENIRRYGLKGGKFTQQSKDYHRFPYCTGEKRNIKRNSAQRSLGHQELQRFNIKGDRHTKLTEASKTQSKCTRFFVKPELIENPVLPEKEISSLDITQDNNFDIQKSFGFKL